MDAKFNAKNGTITFTLPVAAPGTQSKSGKSHIVATTGGNASVNVNGLGIIKLGINAYATSDILAEVQASK